MINCVLIKDQIYAKMNGLKLMKLFNCEPKMSSALLKKVIVKMCLEIIHLISVWKGFDIKWPTVVHLS